jgi:hypothetical protein
MAIITEGCRGSIIGNQICSTAVAMVIYKMLLLLLRYIRSIVNITLVKLLLSEFTKAVIAFEFPMIRIEVYTCTTIQTFKACGRHFLPPNARIYFRTPDRI